jgi:hypothetical protein
MEPKTDKTRLNPDRGRVRGNLCGISRQVRLVRVPIGRYSPRSYKDRFVVPLT